MVKRHPSDYAKLLREQYVRLVAALGDFYSGQEFQALNVAVTLRVLVRETSDSHPLLSQLNPGYWDMTIQHKPLKPKMIFNLPVPIIVRGDGTKRIERTGFDLPDYRLVPLRQWWNDDYQPIGGTRLSKKTIVLNVANKSGGAHIDTMVPDSHVALSEPPFAFGIVSGDEKIFMQPDLALGITAQAGCEMQDYLERHFQCRQV